MEEWKTHRWIHDNSYSSTADSINYLVNTLSQSLMYLDFSRCVPKFCPGYTTPLGPQSNLTGAGTAGAARKCGCHCSWLWQIRTCSAPLRGGCPHRLRHGSWNACSICHISCSLQWWSLAKGWRSTTFACQLSLMWLVQTCSEDTCPSTGNRQADPAYPEGSWSQCQLPSDYWW